MATRKKARSHSSNTGAAVRILRRKKAPRKKASERPEPVDVEVVGPAAEWVSPDSLQPWADNPRHNEKAVEAVARSIRQFGFGAPIVARRENRRIIAGHTRWLAAKKLGLNLVPVRFVDVSDEQARAMALADNRIGEIADWDVDKLVAQLRDLDEYDDVELTDLGWSRAELDAMFAEPDLDTSPVELPERYKVIVECADERSQGALLKELEKRGYRCSAMMA